MSNPVIGSGGGRPTIKGPRIATVQGALIAAVLVVIGVVGLAALQGVHLFETGTTPATQATGPQPGTAAAFAYLSVQHSNFCSLSPDKVMGYSDDGRLQGACCNPMEMAKYEWQVNGVRHYSGIKEIPQDPYDISVAQAKELLGYDGALMLSGDQQAVYDTAIGMTRDKAPCCCQCWRWYMIRGLAKFLIVNQSMGAEDVGAIVDLVNGCGGPMEEGGSATADREASG